MILRSNFLEIFNKQKCFSVSNLKALITQSTFERFLNIFCQLLNLHFNFSITWLPSGYLPTSGSGGPQFKSQLKETKHTYLIRLMGRTSQPPKASHSYLVSEWQPMIR